MADAGVDQALIDARPTWQPDQEASRCPLCQNAFNLFRRRHHCRSCGKCVCDDCSKGRKQIPRLGYDRFERVCDVCVRAIEADDLAEQASVLETAPRRGAAPTSPTRSALDVDRIRKSSTRANVGSGRIEMRRSIMLAYDVEEEPRIKWIARPFLYLMALQMLVQTLNSVNNPGNAMATTFFGYFAWDDEEPFLALLLTIFQAINVVTCVARLAAYGHFISSNPLSSILAADTNAFSWAMWLIELLVLSLNTFMAYQLHLVFRQYHGGALFDPPWGVPQLGLKFNMPQRAPRKKPSEMVVLADGDESEALVSEPQPPPPAPGITINETDSVAAASTRSEKKNRRRSSASRRSSTSKHAASTGGSAAAAAAAAASADGAAEPPPAPADTQQ